MCKFKQCGVPQEFHDFTSFVEREKNGNGNFLFMRMRILNQQNGDGQSNILKRAN